MASAEPVPATPIHMVEARNSYQLPMLFYDARHCECGAGKLTEMHQYPDLREALAQDWDGQYVARFDAEVVRRQWQPEFGVDLLDGTAACEHCLREANREKNIAPDGAADFLTGSYAGFRRPREGGVTRHRSAYHSALFHVACAASMRKKYVTEASAQLATMSSTTSILIALGRVRAIHFMDVPLQGELRAARVKTGDYTPGCS